MCYQQRRHTEEHALSISVIEIDIAEPSFNIYNMLHLQKVIVIIIVILNWKTERSI